MDERHGLAGEDATVRLVFVFPLDAPMRPSAPLHRLELTGWRLWGRYRRRIPMHRILQADVTDSNCLLLWMADGQTLRLRLDDARRWQEAITKQLKTA